MKLLLLYVTQLTLLFVVLPATATPLGDKAAALKKAINDEIASKPEATAPNAMQRSPYGDPRMVAAGVDQLLAQMDNPGMSAGVETQITQLLSVFTSDGVQKAGQDLIAEIHLERKAKADAAAAEIQALLKRVSDEINQTTKPEDLDSLLVDLQKFQSGRNNEYNPDEQALYQQVSGAFEFTKLWQNYLSHVATGQNQLATNDLQNLSQNNYSVGIIPRSKILSLLAPTAQSGTGNPPPTPVTTAYDSSLALLKSLKSLDEMRPALEKIESMPSDNGMRPTTDILKQLIEIYESAKVGLPVDIGVNVKYLTQNGVSPELQRQLVAYVFQKYFATYKGDPPGSDENLSLYVDRVTSDAISRLDWVLLKQTLNVREFLDENSSMRYSNTRPSTSAIDSLLAGINQEEASQYMLAVVSYQSALKNLPENKILPKLIGDKLAAIQKDHPKEYDQGMQLVMSPPVRPAYTVYPPGRASGSPPYQAPYMPGVPGTPLTNAPPANIPPPSTPVAPLK